MMPNSTREALSMLASTGRRIEMSESFIWNLSGKDRRPLMPFLRSPGIYSFGGKPNKGERPPRGRMAARRLDWGHGTQTHRPAAVPALLPADPAAQIFPHQGDHRADGRHAGGRDRRAAACPDARRDEIRGTGARNRPHRRDGGADE